MHTSPVRSSSIVSNLTVLAVHISASLSSPGREICFKAFVALIVVSPPYHCIHGTKLERCGDSHTAAGCGWTSHAIRVGYGLKLSDCQHGRTEPVGGRCPRSAEKTAGVRMGG